MPDDVSSGGEATDDAEWVAARFPHHHRLGTRWADNDVYGHVNNVEYYAWFDTAINAYLVREGGLDILTDAVIGLCVESHCAYRTAIAFPDEVTVGLRVAGLGRSSVRYELAVFRSDGADTVAASAAPAAAVGWFVHVFVGREGRRPTPIPERLRTALERLQATGAAPARGDGS